MGSLVNLTGHKCEKCGHEWLPRKKSYVPKVCPKCKNPNWEKPVKRGSGNA